MDTTHSSSIAQPMAYQLCRTRTANGEVDLVLNLFVGQEAVSARTIARLAASDVVRVVNTCVAHLEDLGARPVEDAVACDRAA